MSPDSSRAKFFRQSGWMVIASLTGGVCMFAVHIIAPQLGDKEYGLFGTLLAMLNVLLIPALGLQTTFAHAAATAIAAEDQARLTDSMRRLLWWTFLIWLVIALGAAVFQIHIIKTLTITNPLALWLVVLFGLTQLWQPILYGVIQGRQNFLWLGWAQIANGFGRFVAVIIIVFFLGGLATGAIGGALIGITLSVLIGFWQSRMVWAAPSRLPFDWRDWLAQVIPLTLGLGASQFIFSVDMLLVRGIYGENQTGFYSASGMIGRGLVMFTTPLSVVMFPKIVHSVAVGKKSNVLLYTLLSTAVLGTLAAAGCTLGAFGLREIIETPGFGGGFLPAALLGKLQRNPDAVLALARLIPWFVWCMLPLAMANVLLNNLLARKNYQAVPYLLLLVAAYVTAAISFADVGPAGKSGASFVRIIQILGVSNLAFLSLCGGFTWRAARKASLQNGAVETIETPVG